MTTKPFAPTQRDMIQRGDIVTVPAGTTVTRRDKHRMPVERVLKRDITVKVRHELWGTLSWGTRRANEGSCDNNDVMVVTWQHGEPTVDFGYLRDVLGLAGARNAAWHATGVADHEYLGEGVRFIGDPADYHSCRIPLADAEILYNRIKDYREARAREVQRIAEEYGPMAAMMACVTVKTNQPVKNPSRIKRTLDRLTGNR